MTSNDELKALVEQWRREASHCALTVMTLREKRRDWDCARYERVPETLRRCADALADLIESDEAEGKEEQ